MGHTRALGDAGGDAGGIVLGWLIKLVVVLGLIGVLVYEIVAIGYGRVAASDDAHSIAQAATEAMVLQHAEPKEALGLAEERADSRGVSVGKGDITITKNGSVTVHVHHNVHTLFVHYIGPLAQFSEVDETYSTPPLTQ